MARDPNKKYTRVKVDDTVVDLEVALGKHGNDKPYAWYVYHLGRYVGFLTVERTRFKKRGMKRLPAPTAIRWTASLGDGKRSPQVPWFTRKRALKMMIAQADL